MNVICVNCKEVYSIRPTHCTVCNGQTFEKTEASPKSKSLADLSIEFEEGKITYNELLNQAFERGKTFKDPHFGTITWFKCIDILPPKSPLPGKERYSDELLLSDGDFLEKGHYCHTPAEGDNPFWTTRYDPTHWALINLPE